MKSVRPAKMTGLLALAILVSTAMAGGAHAGKDRGHYRVSRDPSIGYAVPIQHVYQFPAPFVFQPTDPAGYAVPIQDVYQFPAPFVSQPGPEVPLISTAGASYDQYGGPSFIPR